MASLSGEITISFERRPCIVGGRKAMFHRWADKAVPHTAIMQVDTSGQVWNVYGIVEYKDGTVDGVPVGAVRFVDDGGFDDIAWPDSAERA